MSVVAITGATGFIGGALASALERDGHTVRRLTRSPRSPGEHAFDPARGVLDPRALDGADAVVHLAGEPLAQRWNDEVRRRIRDSRVDGTRLVVEALATLTRKPAVLVSGSAVGYYGDRGDDILTEESGPGRDFLAEVCVAWEKAAAPAADAGVRLVLARTGIVLDRRGGALEQLLLPFRLGVGGPTGSGRQWMSWISLDDTVAALRHALDTPTVSGPVNVVGPAPATNAEFMRALGRALHRPALLRTPPFALRLLYEEMADATLLASQRAMPEALRRAGFRHRHATLEAALRAALA